MTVPQHGKLSSTPTDVAAGRLAMLGAAASLNAQTPSRRGLPLAALKVWIEPAVQLGQARVFYDARSQPVGYAVWAFLTPPVAARVRRDPGAILHPGEWNEGAQLWVLDLVAVGGHGTLIARGLLNMLAEDAPTLRFVRRDRTDAPARRVRLKARAAANRDDD